MADKTKREELKICENLSDILSENNPETNAPRRGNDKINLMIMNIMI